MRQVAFWVVVLGVVPLASFLAALAAEGSTVVQWLLLLAVPPASSVVLGLFLGMLRSRIVAAALLSTATAWLYVLVLIWYLFEIVGVR